MVTSSQRLFILGKSNLICGFWNSGLLCCLVKRLVGVQSRWSIHRITTGVFCPAMAKCLNCMGVDPQLGVMQYNLFLQACRLPPQIFFEIREHESVPAIQSSHIDSLCDRILLFRMDRSWLISVYSTVRWIRNDPLSSHYSDIKFDDSSCIQLLVAFDRAIATSVSTREDDDSKFTRSDKNKCNPHPSRMCQSTPIVSLPKMVIGPKCNADMVRTSLAWVLCFHTSP